MFGRLTAPSLYGGWSSSSPQLLNLFWITASQGLVSWNDNLLNFQMFILSKRHIEWMLWNVCAKKTPVCLLQKIPWTTQQGIVCVQSLPEQTEQRLKNIYAFLFWKHLAQSIASGSVFNILFCRLCLCLRKNNICWLLLFHQGSFSKTFWVISNYSQFCIYANL